MIAVDIATAPPTEELRPGDHGTDWGQFNVVVAVPTPLRGGRHVRASMAASTRHPPLGLVEHFGERARGTCSRRPFPRWPLGGWLGPSWAVMRRRRVENGGALSPLAQHRHKLDDPRLFVLDHCSLLGAAGRPSRRHTGQTAAAATHNIISRSPGASQSCDLHVFSFWKKLMGDDVKEP